MPYADPEMKRQKDRERKSLPETKARHREQYRKRYSENANGLADKVRAAHYVKWKSEEYKAVRRAGYARRWENDWAGQTLTQLKAKAKKKGLDFDLESSDLVMPSHCPIFGIPLAKGKGSQCNASPSVDRIDNEKGYVKGNVVVVSLRANSIKRDTTLAELKKMVEFYENLERLKNE